ncbi:hypothetical protein BH09MYX1_BH09MYX1_05500 [soil metagenome]
MDERLICGDASPMLRRAGALLVGILSCTGCALTASPIGEVSFPHGTSGAAGVGIDLQFHTPFHASDGLAFGVRMDHLIQASPYVDYDRSRYLIEVGGSWLPRGYRRHVGFEMLALAGVARGAMGAADPTGAAFSTGLVVGLPIRIGEADFGDNPLFRPTFLLVPFITTTFAYPVATE